MEREEAFAEAQDTSSSPHAIKRPTWIATAAIAAAIVALVGILGTRSLLVAPGSSGASTTSAPAGGVLAPAAAGDPIGVLRYQDGAALVDEVSFKASGMPLLAPGNQYEVWLRDETGEEVRSVGYLHLDAEGNGSTSFVDPQGRNLLAQYGAAAITIEPDPDPSPNPSETLFQSVQLPEEGLLHIRHLLVSFAKAPAGIGLLDGLVNDSSLATQLTKAMLDAYEAGDETATRSNAEEVLNVLVGSQSPDYADWDGDGEIEDPGDGYGLMLNGDNSGYIQGSFNHAEFATNSDGATDNMQSHGTHVMVSAQNLETWAPLLRDLAKRILAAPFGPSMGSDVRQAVALANNMFAGTDLNGNERIEAITGEGGAMTGYQHALYMADMVVTLPE